MANYTTSIRQILRQCEMSKSNKQVITANFDQGRKTGRVLAIQQVYDTPDDKWVIILNDDE